MLLTAFAIFLAEHTSSNLKLVLTGAPGSRCDYVRDAAGRMGIAERVIFPGYLPEDDLSILLHCCTALIFPSIFEGFGMPLLEAMEAGRPLLCANSTSLPEVAGDAALFFDARKPSEIAGAIGRIDSDPQLLRDLAARSAERLSAFGGAEDMAASYLKVFQSAVLEPSPLPPGIYGAFRDGWVGKRFVIKVGQSGQSRKLRLVLFLPEWTPMKSVSVRIEDGGAMNEAFQVHRGEHKAVVRPLGMESAALRVACDESFQPKSCAMGPDERCLTLRLETAEILGVQGVAEVLNWADV
jgi:hypothetical protein